MNITEIARLAGVSKTAVSRYFNGGYLSAEKRAAIAAVVEQTGYLPSQQARTLRTRRTRQVGVVMPRLSSESTARVVDGISLALADKGYQLLYTYIYSTPPARWNTWTPSAAAGWTGCCFWPAFLPRSTGRSCRACTCRWSSSPKSTRGTAASTTTTTARRGRSPGCCCAGAASGRCTSASPRGTTPPAMPATRATWTR